MAAIAEDRNKLPPGLAFALDQQEWTPRTLEAMDKCADQRNACHGCMVKESCRRTYDQLLDTYQRNLEFGVHAVYDPKPRGRTKWRG